MEELIEELGRFREWLLATGPIRVLVAAASSGVLSPRRGLEDRLEEAPDIEILRPENDESASGPPGRELGDWLRAAVPHADVVVFLAPCRAGCPRAEVLEGLIGGMTPVSLAFEFGKRALAWGLVSPVPDAGALPRPVGSLLGQVGKTSLGGVLRDRDLRILREAWQGEIQPAEVAEGRVVGAVRRAARHARRTARARRVLAAAGAVVFSGWLLARFGFFGLLLILALAGGSYLWILDRRWDRSGR